MGDILRKIKELFNYEEEGSLSVRDIKPKYKSNEEYLKKIESEINEMLRVIGQSEEQVYEYIENSSVFNQEMENIYSKLHTLNSLKLHQRA